MFRTFENAVMFISKKNNWEYVSVKEVHSDFETGLIAAA